MKTPTPITRRQFARRSLASAAVLSAPALLRGQNLNSKLNIAFIGAGSTVFMKNIVGDILLRPALSGSTIALMDIDPQRLAERARVSTEPPAPAEAPVPRSPEWLTRGRR